MFRPAIAGFAKEPKYTAQHQIYQGRFTCPDVQWTQSGGQTFCTFTVTAGQIADAAANGMLWTDQNVQRGIIPGVTPEPPRELSLSSGYPNTELYVFDSEKADAIVNKLLYGESLFLSPLIWNLRPKSFDAYWDDANRKIYIYNGKIYLPDSHHRHQAIIKAMRLWRDAPSDYPSFNESIQFKIEMYFLNVEGEGNYFFDKNQLPKPTAKSKAYDLTTQDDLSVLAKNVIEKSTQLSGNVNRVTDRLAGTNPQVLTLSTLREMMRTFASDDAVDGSEMEGLAQVAAQFYDMLADVRPELGHQTLASRKFIRSTSLVDAAVMMHGYAFLMRDYNTDIGRIGPPRAREQWDRRLALLSGSHQYEMNGWRGDIFEKKNPLWALVGVTRLSADATKITTLNTGAARIQAGRVLRQLTKMQVPPRDISFLSGA